MRFLGFVLLSFSVVAFSVPKSVRWTGKEDPDGNLTHVFEKIKDLTGFNLSAADFMIVEDRVLATSHFLHLTQTAAGLPVSGQSVRIWKSIPKGEVIQVEARFDAPPTLPPSVTPLQRALSSTETVSTVRAAISQTDDTSLRDLKYEDVWQSGALVRVAKAKGKRGTHTITLSLPSGNLVSQKYDEFPQDESSIPVQVFPIYEEVPANGKILPREESELRHLLTHVRKYTADPFSDLTNVHYVDDHYDPLLGLTVQGRKAGFWAMAYIKEQAASLQKKIKASENSFDNGGLVLEGTFATVSLYPEVAQILKPLSFTPGIAGQLLPIWKTMQNNPDHEEMVPVSALLGKPIASLEEAWNRPARRLKDHDAASYLNDGFDEIQVYWAVTQCFESLRSMGFLDPDLSTRPFHAFLYNPDISYRDNAFYTDDTINFTTYSGASSNMARDNTTIWHELGHGVMDRLMGDHIRLADTGGLSEGMADFVAQLILNDVTGGITFEGKEDLRIFNRMGFHLSNEVHDDGEAYGGAMNDLLRLAMAKWGKVGLAKVTDLTLETMRLTRNHPGLTATDWFEHMLFADELGQRGVRRPEELKTLITQSLNGRNFVFGPMQPAQYTLMNGKDVVTNDGPGSRPNPIRLKLKEDEKKTFTLNVALKSSAAYAFRYPATVKVDLKTGPLQGAIRWDDEAKSPLSFTLNAETDAVSIPLTAYGKCDEINRPDKSCVDYAYVQIFNRGEKKPQAKKRFYLRIYPQ